MEWEVFPLQYESPELSLFVFLLAVPLDQSVGPTMTVFHGFLYQLDPGETDPLTPSSLSTFNVITPVPVPEVPRDVLCVVDYVVTLSGAASYSSTSQH